MNQKVQGLSLLLVIGLAFSLYTAVSAGSGTSLETDLETNLGTNAEFTSPSLTKKELIANLRRLDFRIEGKSCAACLLSIQRKLNSLPGVNQAAVMLKRPFGASVIYQGDKIKKEEILAVVENKEPNIKLMEVRDAAIFKMPSPIIPPFVPVREN